MINFNIQAQGNITEKEKEFIINSFPKNIKLRFTEKDPDNLGFNELPLVVNFLAGAIVSGIIYDLLKKGITQIIKHRKEKKLERDIIVKIHLDDCTIVIQNEVVSIYIGNQFDKYIELDELFNEQLNRIEKK